MTIPEAIALALRYHQAGQLKEAEQVYRQILQVNPHYPDAHHLLGVLVSQRGQHDQAVAYIRQAMAVKPGVAVYHNNLAFSLQVIGHFEEALWHCRQAAFLQPDYVEAHTNMGNAYRSLGQREEAIACYQRALAIHPDYALAHNNIGVALQEAGKLEESIACFRKTLALDPNYVDALNNLGAAFHDLGDLDEAEACYLRALALEPDSANAHSYLANLWLLRGDCERGWPEYEWRWKHSHVPQRSFGQPLWDGSNLEGRAILLHAEQGFGDTLQVFRYVPLVKERGGKIVVECQPRLERLLTGAPGVDHLLPLGSPLPPFDVHAPLLSLPRIFRTTLDTIPQNVPYLHADARMVEDWRKWLAASAGREMLGPEKTSKLKIGLAWQGDPSFRYDRQRSIPLRYFEILGRAGENSFICLQKGHGSQQMRDLSQPSPSKKGRAGWAFSVLDLGSRLDEGHGPFMDTAAIMKCLDLVICSDSAVAHLAGALGVPVWVALPMIPDWRWLLQREDCPWYPTMRLFRQGRLGDWEEVFERMARELKKFAEDH